MKLTEPEKQAIVTLLAQFHRPVEVVVQMREQFGVEVDRFQVRVYDPTNPRYEGGEKWRSIFDAARAAYLSAIEDVPIAHAAYRFNELQNCYDQARKMGNLALASAMLRQAAWETKGLRAAAPARRTSLPFDPTEMTPEERRAKMVELLNDALRRKNDPAPIDEGSDGCAAREPRECALALDRSAA